MSRRAKIHQQQIAAGGNAFDGGFQKRFPLPICPSEGAGIKASGVLARKRRCRQQPPVGDRCGMSEVDEDFFLMANLFPADTGLAMVVWVSERGHARHDVRIKVNQSHGTRMLPGNLATVAVRPTPRLIAGQLSAADMQAVSEWIRLNEAALVAYWEYQISTAGLMQQLRRLP
jgi:hypothetical protein